MQRSPAVDDSPVAAKSAAASDDSRSLQRQRYLLVAGVAALVVGVGAIGAKLIHDGVRLHLLGGVLIRGEFDLRIGVIVVVPLALAAAVIWVGPRIAARVRFGSLLLISTVASAIWAVALAATKSGYAGNGITGPLESRYEYLYDVPRVSGLGDLLSSYVASVPSRSAEPWTTHVAGHPPGPLALFAFMQAIGLGGSGWAAGLCIAAGVSTVPAVLVAVRAMQGAAAARAISPYLVLAPWWLWVATSADALWMGMSAWGIASLCVAGRRRGWLVGGGVLLGLSAFGSYGVVLIGLVALAVLWQRQSLGRIWWVGVGALGPVIASGIGGFWWWEGLVATSSRVASGPASIDRPYAYFLAANLAVAALALGPAVIAAFRGRIFSLPLVWAAAAAILIADLTGLSKGEVERIWIPFYPWITVSVVLLPRSQDRRWLAAQVLTAIAIQFFIRTEW